MNKIRTFFTWDFFRKGLKFGLTSGIAFILNFGINIIGHEYFGISVNITYPIALVTVSLTAFLLFRFFVYPGAEKKNPMKQGWQFILSTISFRCAEWLLFLFLYNVIALQFHWWYICCLVIVQTLGTVSKFFFYNFFIFGHGNTDTGLSTEQAKKNFTA